VSVTDIIREIQSLSKAERAKLIEFVHSIEEAEIPDSFRRGMADIEAGRVVDMEAALNKAPPSHR
jgi:predicted transcriptional regulator